MSDETGASIRRRAWIIGSAMLVVAGVGQAIVPTTMLASQRGSFRLSAVIPEEFGSWRLDRAASGGIINPQTKALLDKLYSQLVQRTYLNAEGDRIMLSVAYGEDQSDPSVQLHYPEVCYPAQGFKVISNQRGTIRAPAGPLPVRRLETHFAEQRYENVTYWTVVGREISVGGWDHKRAEILHGLKGEIVDGTLVRVSNISRDSAASFALQDGFIRELLAALRHVPGCDLILGQCTA